ncbi:protein of unknown function DUF1778 [Candidatus Protofrankia datiscae]|uniref:Uncharacterized protein n=1 Tax=Candidatus Protofrankia datiscae TaxID=2716812 RepID=F8AVW2_9ACTN|nr:protein of unknown function DUF1778 [Candidatus Protofrankia datiscae]
MLREYELITRVPAGSFDELLASLDAPAEPNDALTRAAARLGSVIERRRPRAGSSARHWM